MPQRFERYRIERGTDLGDPKTWDMRFEDLDLRLAAVEGTAEKLDRAVDLMTAAALSRLNDTFTPLIIDAQTRLANFGALFTARSESAVAIATGELAFVLTPQTAQSFVFADYAYARAVADETQAVIGRVVAYEREARLLTLDVELTDGSGTYDDWSIGPAVKPDIAHTTRIDNPHQTTAAQVGAYSIGEANALLAAKAPSNNAVLTGTPEASPTAPGDASNRIATTGVVQAKVDAAIAALVGLAPPQLNTLVELAAAVLENEADVAEMLSALGNRMRFDAAQVLNATQRTRVFDNLSLFATVKSLLLATDASSARAAIGAQAALGYTPLNAAANLSDVPDKPTARAQLGLGSAATHAHGEYLTAGVGVSALANDMGYQASSGNGTFNGHIDCGAGVYYFKHNTDWWLQHDAGNNQFVFSLQLAVIGNFFCSGAKFFDIAHPLDPARRLRHAAIEAPEAGVMYRGRAALVAGHASVALPSYFAALADEAGATVLVTPIVPAGAPIPRLAASAVHDGHFAVVGEVESEGGTLPSDATFYWQVCATRRDMTFEVEPVQAGPG